VIFGFIEFFFVFEKKHVKNEKFSKILLFEKIKNFLFFLRTQKFSYLKKNTKNLYKSKNRKIVNSSKLLLFPGKTNVIEWNTIFFNLIDLNYFHFSSIFCLFYPYKFKKVKITK
jgi:hypothetical protein